MLVYACRGLHLQMLVATIFLPKVYMKRSLTSRFTTDICPVIPDFHQPDNVQNFDSGAVGSPSAEQIWAFKNRQFANEVDLLRALIENMNDSVPPNREAWASGGKEVLTALNTLQHVLGNLCEVTANPKP